MGGLLDQTERRGLRGEGLSLAAKPVCRPLQKSVPATLSLSTPVASWGMAFQDTASPAAPRENAGHTPLSPAFRRNAAAVLPSPVNDADEPISTPSK